MIIFGSILYYRYRYSNSEKISIPLPKGSVSDSIVVFKAERKLYLYNKGKVLKIYHVSLGDNPVGLKEKEGDEKTPEGLYTISSRNPNSKYHLSLRISYPNENDIAYAKNSGFSPGGDIMIHGLPNHTGFLEDYYVNNDWTNGCIAVNNIEIEEIWGAVEDGTPIYINK